MRFYLKIFDLFMLCFGAYLLYAGWSGKGALYRSKENTEDARRPLLRRFCLIGGPLAIATGMLDFLRMEPLNNILFTIFILMVLAVILTKKLCKSAGKKR